jgi:hypothetical protein
MKDKKKPGRPKGKIKEPMTIMCRIDKIQKLGGMEKAKELLINQFEKL